MIKKCVKSLNAHSIEVIFLEKIAFSICLFCYVQYFHILNREQSLYNRNIKFYEYNEYKFYPCKNMTN